MGITSTRKVEVTALLERRGAEVESAPAMAIDPVPDDAALRAATRSCIDVPPDLFVATTGLGLRRWFEAAASWMLDDLLAALAGAEVIARGPKSVGALRAHGLRERWSPPSECFDDVLAYLRGSTLTGRRIVVQEHGRSLSVANALRGRCLGRDGHRVPLRADDDQAAMFRMVDLVADRRVDAVTFTSAPAPDILLDVAAASGAAGRSSRRSATACSPPASARSPRPRSRLYGVPVLQPGRARLAAMVRALEVELPSRRGGTGLDVRGHRLLLHGDSGLRRRGGGALSPAPLAVLRALAERPATSCRAASCWATCPAATPAEHAVEVAVGRLRAAVGPRLVQTVVKRGYRLPVT